MEGYHSTYGEMSREVGIGTHRIGDSLGKQIVGQEQAGHPASPNGTAEHGREHHGRAQ